MKTRSLTFMWMVAAGLLAWSCTSGTVESEEDGEPLETSDAGPDAGADPGGDPGSDPGADPGSDPAPDGAGPLDGAGADPGSDPGGDPGGDPGTADSDIDPTITRFGIFYCLWHCEAAHSNPIHDISEILAGRQDWAPFGNFYWWDEPEAGYYCLSENDNLLRQHAEQLRDAGIDFVFLDATNHAYVGSGSDDTPGMILQPLDRLLAVWSTVDGAPRVVPWVPVAGSGVDPSRYTVDAMLQRMAATPGMQFEYQGKPLVLVVENEVHTPNETHEEALEQDYTVRRMWGVFSQDGPKWSFLQRCQQNPNGPLPCSQRVAVRDGVIEQVSITMAYQEPYMSIPAAVPKYRGLTFRKQFERAFENPEVPVVTITGWNEWVAQRQPCDRHPSCPCTVYPDGCFVDTWDIEYNRDIEPGKNAMGDFYVHLLTSCIRVFKDGGNCGDGLHDDEVCCQDWDASCAWCRSGFESCDAACQAAFGANHLGTCFPPVGASPGHCCSCVYSDDDHKCRWCRGDYSSCDAACLAVHGENHVGSCHPPGIARRGLCCQCTGTIGGGRMQQVRRLR